MKECDFGENRRKILAMLYYPTENLQIRKPLRLFQLSCAFFTDGNHKPQEANYRFQLINILKKCLKLVFIQALDLGYPSVRFNPPIFM
jgi:hypothetical protein